MGTMISITTYYLQEYVNSRGIPSEGHDGHYLEIEFFSGNNSGRGTYIIASNVRGTFEFTRTQSGSTFDACYVGRPDQRFVLTPVRGASGDIVGLTMTFADAPMFAARFANSQTIEDIVWKELVKPDPVPAQRHPRKIQWDSNLPRTFSKERTELYRLRQRFGKRTLESRKQEARKLVAMSRQASDTEVFSC